MPNCASVYLYDRKTLKIYDTPRLESVFKWNENPVRVCIVYRLMHKMHSVEINENEFFKDKYLTK